MATRLPTPSPGAGWAGCTRAARPISPDPNNIAEHTGGRFRPKGLAREAIALDEPLPAPARALRPALAEAPEGPALLLLTEEDLHPESLPLAQAEIRGILGCHATRERSDFEVSEHAIRFAFDALADGLTRASTRFGVAGESVERLTGELLVQKCRALGVERIVTAYLPVGPMAEQIAKTRPALDKAGIAVVEDPPRGRQPHLATCDEGLLRPAGANPPICLEDGHSDASEPKADLFATDRRAAAHR